MDDNNVLEPRVRVETRAIILAGLNCSATQDTIPPLVSVRGGKRNKSPDVINQIAKLRKPHEAGAFARAYRVSWLKG